MGSKNYNNKWTKSQPLGEREKINMVVFHLKILKPIVLGLLKKNELVVSFFQSNIEGEIVNKIQEARNKFQGLIINAGGYTHTSVAIHDALKILKIPIIELHITNIYNREDFRHKSLISKGKCCYLWFRYKRLYSIFRRNEKYY